eukprot:3981996-Pyramimonas_sp.AAC.1
MSGKVLLMRSAIREFMEAIVTEELDGISHLDEGERDALAAGLDGYDAAVATTRATRLSRRF